MNNQFKHENIEPPKVSFWTGIPFKMLCASGLAGLVISIIITAIQLTGELADKRDQLKQDIKFQLNAVAGAAADAAFQIDVREAKLIISGLFELPEVSHAEITTDINGTLYRKPTVATADEFKPLTVFLLGENARYEQILTIPGRPGPVGSLIVRLDLNKIADDFIAGAKSDLYYIFVGVMFFSSIMGVVFYYLFARPLIIASMDMKKWLVDVDEDITITIPKSHKNDEMGALLYSIQNVIDARKDLDIRLKQQQRALDEHAIVSTTNISGKIIDVNDKFVDISGYSREELLGHTHRMVKSDEHSQEFYEDLWRTISSGKPWTGEVKNLTKNAQPYWVKATIFPFKDDKGNIVKYVSMRTDITDLKEKEAEILQFKSTFDLMLDEIYMFGTDTLQIFYANEAALNGTGLTEEDLYRLTLMDISPDSEKDFLCENLKSMINGSETSFKYRSSQYQNDDAIIPTETIIELIKPKNEKPRFVAIVVDIRERLELDKAKAGFISTVSHELRTPLTSIKGGLGLVRAGALGIIPDNALKILDTAYKNSNHLENLINDILDVDMVETGMMSIEIKPFDIAALLADTVEDNKGLGDEYGITFALSGVKGPVLVNGDRSRIMQVISNLMSNAAKFSNSGDEVRVALTEQGTLVRVSVIDEGSGIAVGDQSSIFDKFSRLDSSDQRQKGGSGLGLSIAKSIIEKHGGNIDLTSKIGKGTTFFFELEAHRSLQPVNGN